MPITLTQTQCFLYLGEDGMVEHDSKALFMYICVLEDSRGKVAYRGRMFRPARKLIAWSCNDIERRDTLLSHGYVHVGMYQKERESPAVSRT